MGIKRRDSFTLIEMIIVIGVIGFALPVMFAILFLVIQQQSRIYSLQIVKKEGDFAYNSMKTTIREYGKMVTNPSIFPSNLYPSIYLTTFPTDDPCPILPLSTPAPVPFIFLYDKSMTDFNYHLVAGAYGDQLASSSARNGISGDFLTSSNVAITNLQFSCYRTSQFAPPVVSLSFTVTKSGTGMDLPTLNYASRFQLRSY